MSDSQAQPDLRTILTEQAKSLGLIHDTAGYREKINQIASTQQLLVKDKKGNDLLIPVRIPCGSEQVIVDACNFVFGVETIGDFYSNIFNDPQLTREEKEPHAQEFAFHISAQLADIFGSDFSNITYNSSGRNFYEFAFTIGDHDAKLGHICFGGQNNTILVMITGTGCQYGNEYWEYNLYNWLKYDAHRAKLTRIDYAHDDFNGAYSSPEIADEADSQGMFALTNNLPSVQHLGDWKRHKGAGRTLQIGKRENGKLYRGYEKGKKFGDAESPWFRSEVEFGSTGHLLELEMLISPTQYFAGAYPYCLELVEAANGEIFENVSRIPSVQKESEISVDKSIAIWKTQAGRYLAVYRELFMKKDEKGILVPDDTKILDMLVTDKADYYPPRLKVCEKFIKNPPTYAPWADQRSRCEIPI